MEYYPAQKEPLSFATAWMDPESLMLHKINQAVKERYHVISPISGTLSAKQTSKQYITRH